MNKTPFGVFIFIFLILTIPAHTTAQENQTDVKIITHLSSDGFITPALSQNGTFIYNNVEFSLYSKINNTNFKISIDNITIINSTISDFKYIFEYKITQSYIDLLEVWIGEDYYSYSNIFVFSYSISNRSIVEREDDITFTELEFQEYINQLKTKFFLSNFVAWLSASIMMFYIVREYKQNKIIEVQ